MPFSAKYSRTALAMAEPSSGSVLDPTSSRSNSDCGEQLSKISLRFWMWELKVETELLMLCWSPMSAYIPSKNGS